MVGTMVERVELLELSVPVVFVERSYSNLPVGRDAAGGDDGLGHGAGAVGDGDGGGLESVMLASSLSDAWIRKYPTSVTVMVLEP